MRHTHSGGGLFPHPENREEFTNLLLQVVDDYYQWHARCAGAAAPALLDPTHDTVADHTAGPGDMDAVAGLLRELSGRLAHRATPFPSPLYLAHMTPDIPVAASLAHLCAMLYNPNNVTPETAPVTTELEHEVSADLCRLIGYRPGTGWAHLSSGGTSANLEAMWIARNLRSVPQAAATHPAAADLVSGRSPSVLANLPVPQVLDLVEALSARGLLPEVGRLAAEQRRRANTSGTLLLARSAHYTWDRCADLLGLAPDDVEKVELTPAHRVDVRALGGRVRDLLANGQPILAVVAMCGSSGEGAVDDLDAILRLRADCERRFGASFYVHVDAAFGGYCRSLWLRPDGTMAPFEDRPLGGSGARMKPEVHAAFRALPGADSVTVDPHKSGHSPYPGGGVVFRDRRAVSLVARESMYFGQGDGSRVPFGPHTLEGGRPGAAAAAVWAAHRQIGLHSEGYGRLLGGCVATAQRLHQRFSTARRTGPLGSSRDADSEVTSCFAPDLNILNLSVGPQDGACRRVPGGAFGRRALDSILAEAAGAPLTSLYVSGNTLTGRPLPGGEEQVLRLCTMKGLGPMAQDVVERHLRAAVSRVVAKAGADRAAARPVSVPAARPEERK
ncbi:pyridoxal phosphate-dependent decarboxylase family protein [Streptomyces sp. NPDC101175]|uniref:pyridoxal phosphate-dependent decarboxylase family protein n=1 Tax=Streptomyces sp. NPDC101175 TaxID=3366123 RepID=UPI0038399BEF